MNKYKQGREKGKRTTILVSFMLDDDNLTTWKQLRGKSRWVNEQLEKLKNSAPNIWK